MTRGRSYDERYCRSFTSGCETLVGTIGDANVYCSLPELLDDRAQSNEGKRLPKELLETT